MMGMDHDDDPDLDKPFTLQDGLCAAIFIAALVLLFAWLGK